MRRNATSWLLLLALWAPAAGAFESAVVEARVAPGPAPAGAVAAVEVRLAPAEGVKLYRDQVKVELLAPAGFRLGDFQTPPGHRKLDPFLDKEVEYYTEPVSFSVAVVAPAGFREQTARFTLRVSYQGCTDRLCYPPGSRDFALEAPVAPAAAPAPPPPAAPPGAVPAPPEPARPPFLLFILLAFLGGLGICYTPCVYPMIPVTVALIGGAAGARGEKPPKGRLAAYTLVYVLGIATSYAALGVAAARAGESISSFMQAPAVLAAVALVMFALALSMFGAFELALPAGMGGWLGRLSGAGSLPALLGAGLVLGLAASPCVSAPLAALLLAVAATGDWLLGALALFAFAWGMSALLIAAGIFPNLLARPGPWMLRVKAAFGAILAAMGLYFVRNLLPGGLFGPAAALAALGAGAALLAAGSRLAEGTRRRALVRGLGGITLVACAYLGFGAALGSGLFVSFVRQVMPATVARRVCPRAGALTWEPYSPAALAAVRAAGRPAVLDFYANWCAACQELEEGAFADPRVAAESRGVALLRLDGSDVTAASVKAAQERFRVLGYPTIILFRADGAEAGRLVGAASADEFLEKLRAVR